MLYIYLNKITHAIADLFIKEILKKIFFRSHCDLARNQGHFTMLKDTQWGQGFRQCFLKIKRTDKSIYNGGLSWIMSYSCVLICNDLVV